MSAWVSGLLTVLIPRFRTFAELDQSAERVGRSADRREKRRMCWGGNGWMWGGPGIAAGATGWTTVNLKPGRYELLCNIAGHYGAGMFTQLTVV